MIDYSTLRPAKVVYEGDAPVYWPDLEGRVGFATPVNKWDNVSFFSAADLSQVNSSRRTVLKASQVQYLD